MKWVSSLSPLEHSKKFHSIPCVSPFHAKDSECDERMLSNIRNPRIFTSNISPRIPSEHFSTLFQFEWHRRRIVTNFHFFHRDPCHRFQFEKWDFVLSSFTARTFFHFLCSLSRGLNYFGVY